MKIYILTAEPYHDNSEVRAVYLNPEDGIAELRKCIKWVRFEANTYQLQEWDMDAQKAERLWEISVRQHQMVWKNLLVEDPIFTMQPGVVYEMKPNCKPKAVPIT